MFLCKISSIAQCRCRILNNCEVSIDHVSCIEINIEVDATF